MAERIVSPGVFTRERDLSFLTQGISEIGGAFIGPTPKGPAFIPTIVRSQQEYVTQFGEADATHYTGLTVKNYLRESGVATIVRILGLNGYDNDEVVPALIFASGSAGTKLFSTLHPSSVGNTISDITVSGSATNFTLQLNVPGTNADITQSNLSTDQGSSAYLEDFLGYSPTSVKGAYVYAIFPEAILSSTLATATTASLTVTSGSVPVSEVPTGFTTASIAKYSVPTISFPGLDTTKLAQITTVTGSVAGLAAALLPQFTTISASNVVFFVPSTYVGTLSSVTYPLTDISRINSVTMSAVTSSTALFFSGSVYGRYSNASTPFIQSQTVGGDNIDLFKLYSVGDGLAANKEVKVSFLNMKKAVDADEWATFTMLVRPYDDTDARIEILEQYDNVTLDPDSPQFIARVVGNSAPFDDPNTDERYYQGDFPNRSSYIYVEMSEVDIPKTAVPFGFAPLKSPIGIDAQQMVAPDYVTSRHFSGSAEGYSIDAVDKKFYYGYNFSSPDGTNPSYLAPLPSGSNNVGSAFNLETLSDVPNGLTAKVIDIDDDDSLTYRRFTVPFQGGFDGLNPARDYNLGGDIVASNSQGFNLANSQTGGSVSYKKAIQAISNQDQWDFNLLVLPGVIYEFHSYIANEALSLCEQRGDAFYLMDTVGLNSTIANATGKAAEIDSNYAATYYPWLRVIDVNTNKLLWVPPSVVLPEIYAYNDNVAAEWFAPAGLNRGGISSAVGVKVRLPQASRDTLYESKVNPIAQFPGQGICVWGQKTLQRRASALDRVNVRRLLIAVKKYIASVSRYLVFEQNVESTRNRFLNIVNPYLASVQERSGLYAFRVVMDESNNTPDIIDRNILYGQLYLQPTKTAEFIILDFNVLPTGAAFPTA